MFGLIEGWYSPDSCSLRQRMTQGETLRTLSWDLIWDFAVKTPLPIFLLNDPFS